MEVDGFYKDHWTKYPLEIQGVLDHLLEIFPEGVGGRRVLDAGSGSGMVSVAFALLGADVTGVDITDQCVQNGYKNANRFNVDCRFLKRNLISLDLEDEKFDIIYSWGVLHHTEDAKASFRSLAKHLKSNGDMIIAVYLKTGISRFWNFSRIFYQKAPEKFKSIFLEGGSRILDFVDIFNRLLLKKQRYMMRGTDNYEIINDWFGVPHRTFHTYEEVFRWFEENGMDCVLVNPATGRFKSTSNFVVRGKKRE